MPSKMKSLYGKCICLFAGTIAKCPYAFNEKVTSPVSLFLFLKSLFLWSFQPFVYIDIFFKIAKNHTPIRRAYSPPVVPGVNIDG